MKYLSVCSGIEAATCAWHQMGWEPVAFSEIEKFPSAVLAHHYPSVPNWCDMTKFQEWPDANVDVLVGGTPCQSFSVAGLRKGLDDPRGNLMLTYLAIAKRYRPKWLVWENVPGVLSSNGGRDFAALLRGLDELGYGWAYRVLDAQYFGVPQRRRRVFVVGYLGNWQRAAAVLFERHSLSGHPAPSRQAREGVARGAAGGTATGGWPADVSPTLNAHFGSKQGLEDQHALGGGGLFVPDVCGALTAKGPGAMGAPEVDAGHYLPMTFKVRGGVEVDSAGKGAGKGYLGSEGFDASEDGTGRGTPLVPVHREIAPTLTSNYGKQPDSSDTSAGPMLGPVVSEAGDIAATLRTGGNDHADVYNTVAVAVAFGGDIARSLTARHDSSPCADRGMDVVATAMQVRRLTPVECERLQGFPDGYTNIPWRNKPESPDGPRYKALGNSMAVPIMRWIGERINQVETT